MKANTTINTTSTTTTTNTTNSTATTAASMTPAMEGMKVPEDDVIQCCLRGDLAQLRRWAHQGVRCVSATPLVQAALVGKLEIVKCLVLELRADINQADVNGHTALYTAAQGGA
jgi:hypothetical protein